MEAGGDLEEDSVLSRCIEAGRDLVVSPVRSKSSGAAWPVKPRFPVGVQAQRRACWIQVGLFTKPATSDDESCFRSGELCRTDQALILSGEPQNV